MVSLCLIFFLNIYQKINPCVLVHIISTSVFHLSLEGLMRINICWIESMTPRLDIQRDLTGILPPKRSARIQTAESGSSTLCISDRNNGGKMVSLPTFSVETHQMSEQETFFSTRVKCPKVSQSVSWYHVPDCAFWADVRLVSPCLVSSCFFLFLPLLRWQRARKGPCYFCHLGLMLCPLLGLLSFMFVILYPWKFVKNLLTFASSYLNSYLNR